MPEFDVKNGTCFGALSNAIDSLEEAMNYLGNI